MGFRILREELGVRVAVRVGLAADRKPDPFEPLGPPQDERERLSRAQIGPAVSLYRALSERLSQDEALRITGRVVHDAAVLFLAHTVGGIDPSDWRKRDDAARRELVEGIQRSFFNAEAGVEDVGPRGFVMRVRSCHFVTLCAAAGHPELAPTFCAGDLAFFNRAPLKLERPGTLAEGADACEFRFRLED